MRNLSDLIEHLSRTETRHNMGRTFERVTQEVFQVVRWIFIVGFARYLEVQMGLLSFTVLKWVLSAFLLGYISSRFLLRPEIRVFPAIDAAWQRNVQFAVNLIVCMVVFMAVVWIANALAEGVANSRALL
ncbi:MAG: hypothetical protein ACE5FS_00610 [Paracoccaceae bacterium]